MHRVGADLVGPTKLSCKTLSVRVLLCCIFAAVPSMPRTETRTDHISQDNFVQQGPSKSAPNTVQHMVVVRVCLVPTYATGIP